MTEYIVVDCRTDAVQSQNGVSASTPEAAAQKALGVKLHRAGAPRALACRVYWMEGQIKNMVRLYNKISEGTDIK